MRHLTDFVQCMASMLCLIHLYILLVRSIQERQGKCRIERHTWYTLVVYHWSEHEHHSWNCSRRCSTNNPRKVRVIRCNFSRKFLWVILQQISTFFAPCTWCDFSAHLYWQFGKGEKSSLSRSIFYTEFHSSLQNMDAALSDPVCSTPNIYFMWTNCPFSTKTCGEKFSAERMDTVPFVSLRSASSAESSADTCGKKSQRVALAVKCFQ